MRKIKLKIKNEEYLLEMNRNSVKWLESNGFDAAKFEQRPITYYDLLWASLFLANHGDVTMDKAIELQETFRKEKGGGMVAKVISFATEEYVTFINALADTSSKAKDEELEIINN